MRVWMRWRERIEKWVGTNIANEWEVVFSCKVVIGILCFLLLFLFFSIIKL